MILQQIYSGNYVPYFIRIAWVLYRKYYKKHFGLFFRTQCRNGWHLW